MDDLCTPPELQERANFARNATLPEKSKIRYMQCYEVFQEWKSSKNCNVITENVMLAYFQHLCEEKKAPTTLWSTYSMLRKMIDLKDKIQISEYHNLIAFFKNKNKGYVAKQAAVFSEENIANFMQNAPNDIYLATKVATIFGMLGACRSDELVNVRVQDITLQGNMYFVRVPESKTGPYSFTISDEVYFQMVTSYKNLRPSKAKTDRFFLNYQKGKCTVQVIGKHKFTKMPAEIATYLKLPNVEEYTGHSFRHTSTTTLANTGADMITIKRHGNWKSDTVAQKYISNSMATKKKTEKLISSAIRIEETTTAVNNCNKESIPEKKEIYASEKNELEAPPKKRFKFVPKARTFSTTPPPYHPETESSSLGVICEEHQELNTTVQLNYDTLVTEYDLDADDFITEPTVDRDNYV